ncbi:hypothetical protein BJY59DRAFT_717255 [Rhodotorula toruloides]
MSSLLRTYTRSFERRPYITLCVANGILMSVGDISAQMLGLGCIVWAVLGGQQGLQPMYDLTRTLRFAVFGASMGPLGGAWNKFLEVNFPLRPLPSASPMQKVKVDSPIPGLEKHFPKGSKLERGTGLEEKVPPVPTGTVPSMSEKEPPVSVVQLAKRVAADQLGMAPISLFIFLFSMSLLEGLDSEETKEKIKQNYLPILLVNWQIWPIAVAINFRYVPLRYRVPFGSILGILWTCFLSFRTQTEK